VAGASRGVGRGLARALGEAGATVIVTARSSETGPRTEMRPESIEDTARMVDAAGGRGHHYLCDHRSERATDAMVHWALRRFGRIDVAACSVWGGNEGYDGTRYPDGAGWGTPFWRRSAEPYLGFLQAGPLPALLLARAVAPAMVAARSGLIALISFGTEEYLGDVFYDSAKAATNRLALGFARELAPHGVTALGLSPGFVATERAQDLGQDAHWQRWRPTRTWQPGPGPCCMPATSPGSTASPTPTAPGRSASGLRRDHPLRLSPKWRSGKIIGPGSAP
jgi:NAD(P)-dependent dehydrogenase (short-subunit alcohol dehydrogenase family)